MALSQRQQAEATTRRILDEYQRSGILPGPLIRSIQTSYVRRTGRIPAYAEVETAARAWVDRWLSEIDKGANPEHAAQE